MPDTVTSKWTLDTSQFDTSLKRSTELTTASGRQIELSAKKAAEAQALAAKLGADTVSSQTLRIISARNTEKTAAADFAKAQALNKAGYLGEEGGANLAAAALQRLTAAKLKAAEASRVAGEAAKKESLTFREHIEGLSIGGSLGESLKAVGETLAVAELANKIREAVAASLEFGEAMQRAREKTGLELSTLSTLHYAAALTGGDFDGMTAAVAKMDKTISAATEGNKTAQAFLKGLGLDAKELAGRSDGAEVAFRKFASTLANTESPIRRVELATGLLGKTGAAQIPTLIQLGANWDTFRQKAADAGVLLDGKTAEQLEAMQQRLKDLQQHILGAGLAFTSGFIPSFNQMLGVISGGKSQMDLMNDWGQRLAKTFAFVAEVVYSAASAVEFLFAAGEGGPLTNAGRTDIAAAKELQRQAQQFHDIAFAKPGPAPTPIVARQEGDKAGGFEGVGDLSGAAAAAQRKANAEAIKQMDDAHRAWEAAEDRSKGDEVAYWAARISGLDKGAKTYQAVLAEALKHSQEAIIALNRENSAAITSFTKSYMEEFNKTGGSLTPELDKTNENKQGQNALAYIQSLRASIDGQKANADAIAKASIQMQVATGNMTKLGAAQALAALHAQEYADALDKLDDAEAMANGMAPGMARTAQLNNIQTQRNALNTSYGIQSQQDQLATGGRDSSALVGATDALNDFTDATRDSGKMMRDFVDHALSSFNAEAVKGLTGQRTSFGKMGEGLARDVTGMALKKGEGTLLSMLGSGGKKDGSSEANALWVRMSGTGASGLPKIPGTTDSMGSASGMGSFLSKTFGGGGDGSDSGSGTGGFFSTVASALIPGFADGVMDFGGGMAMVGEYGPELVNLPHGSSVIPNRALGGDTHNWNMNVDARGATDAAEVRRQVMAAAPHIAAAAVKAVGEQRMRRPSRRA